MAVILDTAGYGLGDRADVVRGAISGLVPATVGLNTPPQSATLRAEAWQLDCLYLLRVVGTGFSISRTERDVRQDAPEIAVFSQSFCTNSIYSANGTTQRLAHHDMHIVDLTGAYDYAQTQAIGGAIATHVSYDQLGLSIDTVRAAIPYLRHSPVLPLLRGHLTQLFTSVDDITDPAAARSVAAATLELIRATVVTATADRSQGAVLHETLRTRILTYIRLNLQDKDLNAAHIARTHNISLRTLYNIWGDQQESLTEWIIQQRLHAAARDLSDEDPRTTVAAIAHRWGFSDSTHFSRRFRSAYGVSPGSYRVTDPGQATNVREIRPFDLPS